MVDGGMQGVWDDSICEVVGWMTGEKYVQKTITKLVISEGITGIDGEAFCGAVALREISLPKSLTYIGKTAFYRCSSLENVTIPNCVTSIGTDAFGKCTRLTNITIPNNVTSIDFYAFENISPSAQITCDFASKPEGWDKDWTDCENVVWLRANQEETE